MVRARACLLACALAAAPACGGEESENQPSPDDEPPVGEPALPLGAPEAPGPHRVGVTTLEIESEGRTIPIEVWYPAHVEEGAAAESYPLRVGTAELARLPSPLGAVRDATLALEGAPHPAVLFSHGNKSWRAQSFYLTEHLASHGFVVIAPEHVGNGLDGSFPMDVAASMRVRPLDLSLALDHVLELSATWPGPLYLAVDRDRVGASGHSFGATSAMRLAGAALDPAAVAERCAAEPEAFLCDGWGAASVPATQGDARVKALLALGPLGLEILGPGFGGTIGVPTMVQGGTHDTITPPEVECVPPYEALATPAWLVLIEGAGHFTFSDVCDFLDSVGATIEQLDDGCGDDDIASADAHAVTATYATAFFRRALTEDTTVDALLAPAASLPPFVARFEAK